MLILITNDFRQNPLKYFLYHNSFSSYQPFWQVEMARQQLKVFLFLLFYNLIGDLKAQEQGLSVITLSTLNSSSSQDYYPMEIQVTSENSRNEVSSTEKLEICTENDTVCLVTSLEPNSLESTSSIGHEIESTMEESTLDLSTVTEFEVERTTKKPIAKKLTDREEWIQLLSSTEDYSEILPEVSTEKNSNEVSMELEVTKPVPNKTELEDDTTIDMEETTKPVTQETTRPTTTTTQGTTEFQPSEENCKGKVKIDKLNATSIEPTQITIEWILTIDEPKCFDRLSITWIDHTGHNSEKTITKPAQEFTIKALEPCNTYNITVAARYDIITLASINLNNLETTPATPSRVTEITVSALSDTELSVTWLPPQLGAYCLTGYNLSYGPVIRIRKSKAEKIPVEKPKWEPTGQIVVPKEPTEFNITGLEACEMYLVQITPIGYDGVNGEADDGTGETLIGIPDPVNLTLEETAKGEILISWANTSTHAYNCVTGYRLFYGESLSDDDANAIDLSKQLTSYQLRKLRSCTSYTVSILQLTASEATGENVTKTLETASVNPSKVKGIKFDSSEKSIDVKWDVPAKELSCVTGYKIMCREGKNECHKDILVGTDVLQTTVNNLRPCVTYTISVVALGKDDKNSDEHSEKIPTLASNISEVKDLKVEPKSNSLIVSWNAPTEAECVASYRIRCIHENWDPHEVETTGLEVEFDNLESCVLYNVTVDVLPINKTTVGATRYLPETTSDEKPSEVRELKVVAEGVKTLSVSWIPPKKGSYCTQNYKIKYQGFNKFTGEIDIEVEEISNSTNYLLKNLRSCTMYDVTVIPMTFQNTTGDQSSQEATTASSPTDPPTLKGDIQVQKSWVNIKFKMPDLSDNQCPLHSCKVICVAVEAIYQATSEKSASIEEIFFDESGEPPPYFEVNVTSLSPYTKYSCVATIKNKADESSKESEPIIFLTLADIPSQPAFTTIEPGITKIEVTWTHSVSRPGHDYELTLFIKKLNANYYIPDNCPSEPVEEWSKTFGITENNYVYEKAEPDTSYEITLVAKTEAGSCEPVKRNDVSTQPSFSESVREFHISRKSPFASLSWNLPCKTNGRLEDFELKIKYRRIYIDKLETSIVKYYKTEMGSIEAQNSYQLVMETKAECIYSIEITPIILNQIHKSDGVTKNFTTPAEIPQFELISYEKIKVDPRQTDNPKHKARLKFPKNIFTNKMGEIRYFALILAQSGNEGSIESGHIDSENGWPDINSWGESDPIEPYQTTPVRWEAPIINGDEHVIYILGEDSSEHCAKANKEYCNGPLRSNTNYSLRIRGFTRNGYNETESVYFKTEIEFKIGLIISLLIIMLIMGSLLSFAIYIKTGSSALWSKKLCAWNGNNQPESVLPPPILQKNFHLHCTQLFSHENQLSSELLLLETLSDDIMMPTYTADLPHNRVKNRYPNIKPYDATRVKLHVSDEFSDYINASYIKGYKGETEYIATQGPKEETVDDFWQMVFENEVKQIVMVTNLTEKGKNKCYKYYPDELDTINCGNGIELDCITMEFKHTYTIRHITMKKSNQEKKVTHIQFHEWPDFGVPSSTEALLKLCREMRSLQSLNYGVILVHCSAGVGRTGTVIAVDILVQAVHENRKIDVFGTVFNLRKQRLRMVQTQEQYKYIYRCIDEEILSPCVFQDRGSYASYYNRGFYGHTRIANNMSDIRRFSTESAM